MLGVVLSCYADVVLSTVRLISWRNLCRLLVYAGGELTLVYISYFLFFSLSFGQSKQNMGLGPSTVLAPNPTGGQVESHITGRVRPIKVGHTWTVNNIRQLCARMKPGECVVSPIFFGGVKRCHNWRLIFYPCGDKWENRGHASLYLQLVFDPAAYSSVIFYPRFAVKTQIQLSIIDLAGKEVNRLRPTQEYCFVKEKTLWGYGRFISHNKLLARADDNPVLTGNPTNARLTIFCSHMDCEPTNDIPAECNLADIRATESLQKLSTDFGNLLRSRELCDVTIETAAQQFPAHKVILSARSPVFAATFAHDMREKTENILVVEDVRAEIMAELLEFVYTGRVTDLEGNVMELLVAADKYAMDDLKNSCEEVLIDSLTIDNSLELLIFADMHNATQLKSRITSYVIANSKDVAASRNFDAAMKSHPQLIAAMFREMVSQD